MCFNNYRENDFQIFSLSSDMIGETDISTVRQTIENGLSDGKKQVALFLEDGMLANKQLVSRLIVSCHELLQKHLGRLVIVRIGAAESKVPCSLCKVLNIPVFSSVDEFWSAVLIVEHSAS